MAYTFTQLIGRVNDIPHRPKNQDLTEVTALVNESYAYVVVALGCLQKTVVKTLTAADGDYNYISDFAITDYAATRALFYTAANGLTNFEPLNPVSVAELQALRQGNQSATSPARCYSQPGWGNVSLQPLPAASDTLTIMYSAFPVALVNPSDTPVALPTHLHHLIVGHASAIAMEQIDVNYAQRMMEQFEERELKRARRWMNDSVSSLPFGPGAYRWGVVWPGDYFSPRYSN